MALTSVELDVFISILEANKHLRRIAECLPYLGESSELNSKEINLLVQDIEKLSMNLELFRLAFLR